ncbi:hypothetical protein [Ornithinimicrobium sp. Y1694]|uniref:hypothetical protein n=1 Tax=Ornithinimicrobium sp. Y1694 TaxID=3418590 RepID=UPI003CF61856
MSPRTAARGPLAGALTALPLALALALSACGTGGDHGAARTSGAPTSSGDAPHVTSGPVAVAEVHRGVPFYPACGNEVLQLDGQTWYQLLPEERDTFDDSRYGLDSPQSHSPDPEFDAAPIRGMPSLAADLPAMPRLISAGAPGFAPMSGMAFPAIPAPEPGDDVGTVTIFTDGMAHFVSDSGELERWLTTEEREYGWVC